MATIDADAHVIENRATWAYMREHEYEFWPQVYVRDSGDGAPDRKNQRNEYWVIDGNLLNKDSNVGKDVPAESGTMDDIERRLAHMDELGIDIQVLYPSLFLRPLTKEPDADFALARSYNRWLAEIWSHAKDRFRWVAVPPLLSLFHPDPVREELRFCKENGACGIFLRGIEHERLTNHRYFFPLYEIAEELDLALCFHAGNNSFFYDEMFRPSGPVMAFKFPVIGAFCALLQSGIPSRFPKARWAFIEASAQWLPYALGEVKLRLARQGQRVSANELLAASNFFVTTQWSDDLPGLLEQVGDDNLLIGTDYGHRDTATEVEALRRLATDGSVSPASVDKILSKNPAAVYGL